MLLFANFTSYIYRNCGKYIIAEKQKTGFFKMLESLNIYKILHKQQFYIRLINHSAHC